MGRHKKRTTAMNIHRLSLVCVLTASMATLAFAVFAADPPANDPFTLPPGYSNARRATDPATPQPATEPSELRTYTTLHSLGFEWDVKGDTDHDATCRVAYRRADEPSWHEALPLARVDYYGWYLKERKA